jgi:hypothetical protein
MSITAIMTVTFTGANASSAPVAISVPDVKVGDIILRIIENTSDGRGADPEGGNGSIFAWYVVTDGEILQQQSDFSFTTLTAVILRFG